MTFKAEFAPEAIDAGVAVAERFGSAVQYLERVMADAREEVRQCAIADQHGTKYVRQFSPFRAIEAYTAYNHAADLLKARAA